MNKKGKSLLIVGILFVVMSMLLTIHFEYEQVYSKIKSDDTMKQILNKTIDNKENIKTIEINGLEYVGYLVIPSLELNLPVTKEYTPYSLKISPSIYYGSIESNNLVICGHAYRNIFGNLYKLKPGDIVIFTDVNNKSYKYEVELIEELGSTDIKEMVESDFDLTIYTCTNDNLRRVTVRCNRVYSKG